MPDRGHDACLALALVARSRDYRRALCQRAARGSLEDGRVGLSGSGGRAQRHRHDPATVGESPLDAGEDALVGSAAAVAEHLAGVDLGVEGDAIARRVGRHPRPAGRADCVRPVAMPVLSLLACDERSPLDRSPAEVGMPEVEAGVEHRQPNAAPGVDRARRSDRLKTPADLRLIDRRDGGRRAGQRARRSPGSARQADDGIAVAAQVLR